jgi:hypothetical protein
MAGNDTAALVVALSAQVSKFQKDMDQANQIADKSIKQMEDRFAASGKVISDKLTGFASNATSQLGVLGVAISALGPIGIGVTATLGSMVLLFDFLAGKVAVFAEKMKELQEASDVTGLTLAQLQALGRAGKQAGLDFDETVRAIERLSTRFEQLRTKGTGELFDELLRIDRGLLLQVASAKDLASALDILSKAFANLDDQQRVLLARALGGERGFAGVIRLFQQLGQAGGLQALQAQLQAAGKTIDETMAPRLRQLLLDIEDIKRATDKMWAQAVSIEVLEAQKSMAESWQTIVGWITRGLSALLAFQHAATGQPASGAEKPATFAERFTGQPRTSLTVAAPAGPAGPDLAAQLELQRRLVAGLGDAATPAEQLKLKILELQKAMADGAIGQGEYTRALNAFRLAQSGAAVVAREALGIAAQIEIETQKLAEVSDKAAKGYIKNAQERATADAVARREAKAAAEETQVRASALPNLTRSMLDAGNAMKQFDALAVSSMNSAADAFADVVTGTKNVSDAVRDMVNNIVRELSRAAFKSVASSLFSGVGGLNLFGARAGGGGVTAGGAYLVGEQGPELFTPGTSGMIVPNDVLRGGGAGSSIVQHVNIVNPTGNSEIERAVAAGVGRANAAAASMLTGYDRQLLPRIASQRSLIG